jgi:hypothetical protein
MDFESIIWYNAHGRTLFFGDMHPETVQERRW